MAFGFGFALTAIAKAVGFSPSSLFASGAQGVWYDPSDYSTLYQDAAGTIPITTPLEKPVGLMLDKSKGLVLGSELVTNGDFSNGTTGWSPNVDATLAAESGKLKQTINGVQGYCNSYQTISVTSGRLYKVTLSIEAGTSTSRFIRVGTAIASSAYGEYSAIGTTTFSFWATGSTLVITPTVAGSNGAYAYFSNISVRELPGNHAYQSTTTSRPLLSARYNLLTKTEQFDDAAWSKINTSVTQNAAIAPDGTTTADKIIATANNGYLNKTAGSDFNNNYSIIDLETGSVTSTPVGTWDSISVVSIGNGWWRISVVAYKYKFVIHAKAAEWKYIGVQFYGTATNNVNIYPCQTSTSSGTADGISGIYLWGADLRLANDGIGLPAYQRVNTSTDYDYAGFPPYLKFDGTDDSMLTNTITPNVDKAQVFAGVRKLSDAAAGIICCLGPNSGANNGSFYMGSAVVTPSDYIYLSKGTVFQAASKDQLPSPRTNVLSGLSDISGDSAILRINGTQAASSSADQGTGNYLAYPIYIGADSTSYWFNGRLYQLVVRFGPTLSAAQIANTEDFVEKKTFGKNMSYVYTDEVLTAASEQITTADGQNVYMTVTYQ